MTPAAQLVSCGSHSSAPTMASWPRGSFTAKPRKRSNSSAKRRRRSASGPEPSGGPPSTMTRVGSPSVWLSITRMAASSDGLRPVAVPSLEQLELILGIALLARRQCVGRAEMQLVFGIALEHHQVLVEEHEVGSFIERGQDAERALELVRLPSRFHISGRCFPAQRLQLQDLAWQHVADAGDRADGAAVHIAVHHLRVDADGEHHVGIRARDMLGRGAPRRGAAEFLEADEMSVFSPQIEKEVGLGLEAIIRAV